MAHEQNQRFSAVVMREQSRLRNFIRRRVADAQDAEDILQDVFYELVEANRLLMPIEHLTGWLFRVARNRIIDLLRKNKPEDFSDVAADEDDELPQLEDLLPSPNAGPEALYARNVLLDELDHLLTADLLARFAGPLDATDGVPGGVVSHQLLDLSDHSGRFFSTALRPPPGCRMRSASSLPSSNSRLPLAIV